MSRHGFCPRSGGISSPLGPILLGAACAAAVAGCAASAPSTDYMVLVVEQLPSRLSFYDPATRERMGQVDVGFWPHEVVVSGDDRTAYWLMAGPNGIVRLDPETGKETGRFPMSTPARGLCYTPDGERLIVSGRNEIFVLDPATLEAQKVSTRRFAYLYDRYYPLPPSALSATAAANGVVLQRALRRVDSLDVARLREALGSEASKTFLGPLARHRARD